MKKDPDITEVRSTENGAKTERRPSAEPADASTEIKPESALSQDAGMGVVSDTLHFDRFEIERELGRGGMGVVYLARDKVKVQLNNPNPWVALKVLSQDFLAYPNALMVMEREADKTQKLAHPNIVIVHDFNIVGDSAYMSMEYLEGKTLEDEIAEHPGGMPVVDALEYLTAMAEGLAYAHAQDVVHADLKPGNVFVTTSGRVKLLDFGLARAVRNSDNDVFDAHELGGLTLAYASLEMHAQKPAIAADDVFALGVIAFELLTGGHPLNGESTAGLQPNQIEMPHIKGVPKHQRGAINMALSASREDRFENAGEFLRALNPPSVVRRSIYAALALVIVAFGVSSYFNVRSEPPDVAFENLDPGKQARLMELINLGDTFYQRNVFQSAYEAYMRAYLVSEREPRVVKRLEEFFADLTEQEQLPINTAENLACKIECLQSNFEFFSTNRALQDAEGVALRALQPKKPVCRRCPDYRTIY